VTEISEPVLRLTAFVLVFAAMAGAEVLRPRRRRLMPRLARWTTNLGTIAVSSAALRGLAALPGPLIAIAVARQAELAGVGLFNVVALPAWLEIALAVVALDFAVWTQHLASHRVPVLWRLHRVHHADRDIDLTTGIRFHPVEMVASMLYKSAWVAALGASPLAVLVFEIILNATSLFNHANLDLPAPVDRALRLFVVTPDMHRVHHSIDSAEHHRNFGFALSIWDRVLGTYVAQPKLGHTGMIIGLPEMQDERPARLGWVLTAPFRADRAAAPQFGHTAADR
jgi:sterol desaturase/sphingolipid hydroxylase (fatty acid hydroxylase superfamily)